MSIKIINSSEPHLIESYPALRLTYSQWIKALARRLALADYDLAEDLEQEGHIALWKVSGSATAANANNTIVYIRSCIRFRMFRFLKREKLGNMEIL